jgi:trigger factor
MNQVYINKLISSQIRKFALKIESQSLENHQIKLTVAVETDVLEEAKKRAARQIAKKVKIPGFRPGKAPYQVIVRQVGEAAITEEAFEFLVNDLYPKVIDESGIQPYGPGNLENMTVDPPVLEFVVPLQAEVKLGDYRSIRQPYEIKEVDEKEIEKVLDELRDRQAILEPAERPVQEGDVAYIKISAHRNVEEEGKESNLITERSMPILINPDEDDKDEWPFPGFSRQLIGLSSNDAKTITHTFAEDSEFETLRGSEAEFHIMVESVKSRTLPELNDDLATSLGEYTDFEHLRNEIRIDLEHHALDTYNETYDDKVLEEIISVSEIHYPPQMLEHEIDAIINNLKNRLESQRLDIDLYLKTREMTMDQLREEVKPTAETRLKKSLVLSEIAKAEKIEVSPDELQSEAARTMNTISRSLPQKDIHKFTDRKLMNTVITSVLADMISDRSLERVREIASGKLDQSDLSADENQSEDLSPEALPQESSDETT